MPNSVQYYLKDRRCRKALLGGLVIESILFIYGIWPIVHGGIADYGGYAFILAHVPSSFVVAYLFRLFTLEGWVADIIFLMSCILLQLALFSVALFLLIAAFQRFSHR